MLNANIFKYLGLNDMRNRYFTLKSLLSRLKKKQIPKYVQSNGKTNIISVTKREKKIKLI